MFASVLHNRDSVDENVNQEALGNINDDIRELIYYELVDGKSWHRIRNQAPCIDCIYQWLCPSPSNYEIAIGRPNLCHVKLFHK